MNYFIEGLQGSGKSTLVKRLSEMHPEYLAVHEGDYSPVELAWCAYVRKDEYEGILEKYDPFSKCFGSGYHRFLQRDQKKIEVKEIYG